MASNALLPSQLPSKGDEKLARQSQKVLACHLSAGLSHKADDPPVAIPAPAARLLMQVLSEMGRGNAVKIIPLHAELTTQEAADLLNVSRPTLIQMLDSGVIAFRQVGTHRRIRAENLMAHHSRLLAERKKALAELSAYDQEIGM